MRLAAELGHGHKPHYILLYQLVDHGCFLFSRFTVYSVTHFLLDITDSGAPRSTDDDGSHTGDRCRQCGHIKNGWYLSVLHATYSQHGQTAQHGIFVFVILQIVVENRNLKIRTGLDDTISFAVARNSP